jgi:hypothetical protein
MPKRERLATAATDLAYATSSLFRAASACTELNEAQLAAELDKLAIECIYRHRQLIDLATNESKPAGSKKLPDPADEGVPF